MQRNQLASSRVGCVVNDLVNIGDYHGRNWRK